MGYLSFTIAYRGIPKLPRLLFASSLALCGMIGPKVNTPEKLAELRRAGVNIGTLDTYTDYLVPWSDSLVVQFA